MHGSQLNIMTSCGCIWRNSTEEEENEFSLNDISTSNGFRLPEKSLMIVNVMSNGQLWRWRSNVPQRRTPEKLPSENLIDFGDWTAESKTYDALEMLETDRTQALPELDPAKDRSPTPSGNEDPRPMAKLELDQILSTLAGSVMQISVLPLCLADKTQSISWNFAESEAEITKPSQINDSDERELGMVSEEAPSATPRTLMPTQSPEEETADPPSHMARTPLLAAVTSTGSLEIVSLKKGSLTCVHPEIISSYAIHECRCRSVRWLGNGPLVVSFSSEKMDGLWKNVIMLTDVRTGESAPFRVTQPETAGMLGIRASHAGKYVVVLLKDSPAEIWMVKFNVFESVLEMIPLGHGFTQRKTCSPFRNSVYCSGLGVVRSDIASSRHWN